MRSEQKLLSSQSRIQQVAKEKFNMFTPVPESLIVYLEDIK
jgi:cell division protein FtsL